MFDGLMLRDISGAGPLLASLLSGVLAYPGPAAEVPSSPTIAESLNLRYCDDHERQKLDVFAPRRAERAPVVLFVHGGSWVGGDKNFFGLYRAVGRFLASNGVVGVLVNYRLSPAVRHPEPVKDVARAFAWARKNITRYGGDPDRVFVCGHSADAHLAALLATDDTYLKAPELALSAADREALCGVIGISGVYRIPAPAEYDRWTEGAINRIMQRAGIDAQLAPGFGTFLVQAGKDLNPFHRAFGDDPKVCKEASPVSRVRKGLPPFLLLYAERDIPGLAEMAREMDVALRKAGAPVQLREMTARTHNSILFQISEKEDEIGRLVLDFVKARKVR